jgi:alkaline phosphatase D
LGAPRHTQSVTRNASPGERTRARLTCIIIWLTLGACVAFSACASSPTANDLVKSGPMLGYNEMTETVIWLQTERPARVQVRYKKRDGGAPQFSREIQTTAEGDHIARVTLSDLEFGMRYDYDVYVNGRRLERSYPLTFQTQPMWKWRTDPPNFRAVIGSCNYVNDPPYDRPGRPYGDDLSIFTRIAEFKPDFMIWLGDNVYYREADWTTERGMRRRYAHTRAARELQPLLATTHHYAIWDDHDFGPNDSDRTFRRREESLRIFKDYWANPTYGTAETPGVFGRFEWGDVEFFLLDDRYYRSPNAMPDGPDKVMFGDGQMRWLMESLRSSDATFKIVAGGNQMMNPMTPFEAFGKFPAEQKKLIDFMRDAKIPGVVFISGDRHLTELIRRSEPGLYPLYDFTSSSLTAGVSTPAPGEENNPARAPGTLTAGKRNFGVIAVAGAKDARVMTLRTLDERGQEVWRYEIKASDLRPPAAP